MAFKNGIMEQRGLSPFPSTVGKLTLDTITPTLRAAQSQLSTKLQANEQQ